MPITNHLCFLKFNSKQILSMLSSESYSTRPLAISWLTYIQTPLQKQFQFSSSINQVTFCLHCGLWIAIFQLGKDSTLWNITNLDFIGPLIFYRLYGLLATIIDQFLYHVNINIFSLQRGIMARYDVTNFFR